MVLRSGMATAVLVLCIGIAPHAQALAFYTDETAWEQAVSNDSIEPYPGAAIITRDQITEQLFHNGTCCQPAISSTSVGATSFTSLSAHYSSVSIDSGFPTTLDQEITIDFPIPIDGFGAFNVQLPQFNVLLNGQAIPSPKDGFAPFPFLGVTGEITSLEFVPGDACPRCDDPSENLLLNDIVVAVPEPPSISMVLYGLGMIGGAVYLRRRNMLTGRTDRR